MKKDCSLDKNNSTLFVYALKQNKRYLFINVISDSLKLFYFFFSKTRLIRHQQWTHGADLILSEHTFKPVKSGLFKCTLSGQNKNQFTSQEFRHDLRAAVDERIACVVGVPYVVVASRDVWKFECQLVGRTRTNYPGVAFNALRNSCVSNKYTFILEFQLLLHLIKYIIFIYKCHLHVNSPVAYLNCGGIVLGVISCDTL